MGGKKGRRTVLVVCRMGIGYQQLIVLNPIISIRTSRGEQNKRIQHSECATVNKLRLNLSSDCPVRNRIKRPGRKAIASGGEGRSCVVGGRKRGRGRSCRV